MANIRISRFAGIAPRLSEKQLAENMATVADNARLDRSQLASIKGILGADSIVASPKTLYKYLGAFESKDEVTHQVLSPISNDVYSRLYQTDSEYPKMRSGAEEFRLGVPAPATAPSVTVNNQGDVSNELTTTTVSYVVTFVDRWGAEGAPSPPTTNYDIGDGFQHTLTMPAVPAGNWNLGTGAKMRIYRSNSGAEGAEYQFAGEILIATTTFVDTLANDELVELISTADNDLPPNDDAGTYPDGPLQGLCELPGGILAGFFGKTVAFSKPYQPWAWPVDYWRSSSETIVGIRPTSGGLLVMTTGDPYLIMGHEPESMYPVPMNGVHQACLSERGAVNMGGYTLYPSPDGLIRASSEGVTNITAEWIDGDTWKTVYQPSTIRAWRFEDVYLAFYGAIDDATGFILDPQAGLNGLVHITGLKVDTGFYDKTSDKLYVGYKDGGGVWRRGEFDAGNALTYSWTSKLFVLPAPVSMAAARIEADAYPVTLTVEADGTQIYSGAAASNRAFRLPGGRKATRWKINLSGTNAVDSVVIADSMSEID